MTDNNDQKPAPDTDRSPFSPEFTVIWRNDGSGPRDVRSLDPDAASWNEPDLVAPDEEDIAAAALRDEEVQAERAAAREALAPARRSLESVGFYAYFTLDDENRWAVVADDEAGRVDVRLGQDGIEVILRASSPGLYADEENPFRRKSLERLARMTIPTVQRGFLESHQSAIWDEIDLGVAVSVRYDLPFSVADGIGTFVREHFTETDELLTFVEERVSR